MVEGLACGICGASGRIGGGAHSHKSGKAGEEPSCKESKRYPRILDMESVSEECKDCGQNDKYYDDNLVLLFEICHRALSDIEGDFFHCRGAFILLHHLPEEDVRERQCKD